MLGEINFTQKTCTVTQDKMEEFINIEPKMHFMGGIGIKPPLDFEGVEIKEGDILTFDYFDPFYSDDYFQKYHPDWTPAFIEERKHKPTFVVRYNPKGHFFAEGIHQNLYLHDFRFKYTKRVKPF